MSETETKHMGAYKELIGELAYCRWKNCYEDSAEENKILDALDLAWDGLSPEERAEAEKLPKVPTHEEWTDLVDPL